MIEELGSTDFWRFWVVHLWVEDLAVASDALSPRKGFSPGMTGMRALYAASVAKRGFTGPSGLFEGPKGLEQMFGQSMGVAGHIGIQRVERRAPDD